jgi:diguanylate cyclase (GGDEF)-like protein
MIEKLKELNENLERERDVLETKNQELNVINRVSKEVAYDLDWEKILPRIVGTGLREFFDYHLFGLFYRINTSWNLAVHVPSDKDVTVDGNTLKERLFSKISQESGLKASPDRVRFSLMAPHHEGTSSSSFSLSALEAFPLSLAGKRLGTLFMLPKNDGGADKNGRDAIGILANILALSLKNAQEYHRVKEMAVTDGLTGIYNRKGFGDFVKREFHRAKRYQKSLALVMMDVDNFKGINDAFGHLAGDYVLRDLASCLRQSVRGSDIVARYGGDEFAVLLPETNAGEADAFMRRTLQQIEQHPFRWGADKVGVGISFGISDTDELRADTNVSALLQRADARLYQAKKKRCLVDPNGVQCAEVRK